MVLIVCAAAQPSSQAPAGSDELLARTAGESHYSYQFVLEQFLPVLEELDIVVRVDRPEVEVDAIFELCQHLGQPCVFLSFAPPQLTPLHLRCRTIPVFAWEFPDIPIEAWDSDPRDDWRHVFREVGSAITHSRFAVDVVAGSWESSARCSPARRPFGTVSSRSLSSATHWPPRA
jgi:hypothetical protein